MSTAFKIIFGVLAGLLLAGVLIIVLVINTARGIGERVAGSAADAPAVAAKIAAFELPAGFQPDYAVEGGGFAAAGFKGEDGRSHLVLVQGPRYLKLDAQELRRYAGQSNPDAASQTTPAGSFETSIRGQAVSVALADGVSGDGQAYRTATAAFNGQNGPTLVTFTRPLHAWDQPAAESLFASIQ